MRAKDIHTRCTAIRHVLLQKNKIIIKTFHKNHSNFPNCPTFLLENLAPCRMKHMRNANKRLVTTSVRFLKRTRSLGARVCMSIEGALPIVHD